MGFEHNDAKKLLEQTVAAMKEKGILTDKMASKLENDLDQLAEQVMSLSLNPDELKNDPKLQKQLMGCLVAHSLGDKQLENGFLNALDPNESTTPEQEKQLDDHLKLGLSALKAISDLVKENPEKKMTADEFVSELHKKLTESLEPKPGAPKQKQVDEDKLGDALRNLYGGNDPRVLGEVQSILTGPIEGNLFGHTNQTQSNSTLLTVMNMENSYNPQFTDGFGKEQGALEQAMSLGINTVLEAIVEAKEEATHHTPNPFDISKGPKLPGE